MQFQPFTGTAPQRVHPGWIDQALTDIGHNALRQSILSSTQFTDRIVARLASSDIQPMDLVDDHPIKALIGLMTPDFLHIIGQLWFAPILAETVLSPARHMIPEIEGRDQLRRLIRYRDHAMPDVIGDLPEDHNYAYEGQTCVAAQELLKIVAC